MDNARQRAEKILASTPGKWFASDTLALARDVLVLCDELEKFHKDAENTALVVSEKANAAIDAWERRATSAEVCVASLREALQRIADMPVRIQPGNKLAENPQITHDEAKKALRAVHNK